MKKSCSAPTPSRAFFHSCALHTHLNTVDHIKGVRYMQNAMGYGIAPGTKLTVVWDGRIKEYAA